MKERARVMGLGTPLIDAKTWDKNCLPLPNENKLIDLLDTHPNRFIYSTGGIVPNILTAYSRFTGNSTFLFGCVGNDNRGQEYQKLLDPLLGKLQVHQTESTGVVVHVLNDEGLLIEKKSFYGAAREVKAPNEVLNHNNLPIYFITSAHVFSMPGVLTETDKVLDYLHRQNNGLFVLNCGGTRPDRTPRELLLHSLSERQTPDIIAGNEAEMCYIAGTSSFEDAIELLFPQSRMVILTREENGSVIRFEGRNIFIPAFPADSKEKLDSVGAGDCYLGVILGALSNIPSNKWKADDIYKTACTASYSASMVMSETTTQLGKTDAEKARNFYNQFKS